MFMTLTAAFILDYFLGDPTFIPHPVVIIGRFVTYLENQLRRPKTLFGGMSPNASDFLKGLLLAAIVCVLSLAVPSLLLWFLGCIHPTLASILDLFFSFQILAACSLKRESMKVYASLQSNDLNASRQALSQIVGRDTAHLDQTQICCATIETIAENTSDGVVAPMIAIALGGAPLGFLYKAINTMDSMLGYKNQRYLYFGRAAAKLDDAANYFSARLTALLMVIASYTLGFNGYHSYQIYLRDRKNHTSPNAGHPEAACAGALNVQLGGPSIYFGKQVEKPFIGDPARPIEAEDIRRANQLMYRTALLALIILSFFRTLLFHAEFDQFLKTVSSTGFF